MLTKKRLFLLLSLIVSVFSTLFSVLLLVLLGWESYPVYWFIGAPVSILSFVLLIDFIKFNSYLEWPRFFTLLIIAFVYNMSLWGWGSLAFGLFITGGFLIIFLHILFAYFISKKIKRMINRFQEPEKIIYLKPLTKNILLSVSHVSIFVSFFWVFFTDFAYYYESGWFTNAGRPFGITALVIGLAAIFLILRNK